MARFLRAAVLVSLLVVVSLTARAAPRQYLLRVDGLSCPFCAYGIEKQLKRATGVERIQIDINAGMVTVTMAEGATMTEAYLRFLESVEHAE